MPAIRHETLSRRPAAPVNSLLPDSVGLLLADVSLLDAKLLSREEEQRLAYVIKEGRDAASRLAPTNGQSPLPPHLRKELETRIKDGHNARNRFVECNVRLAVNIAKHYQGNGVDLPDLVQAGMIGVIDAVEVFDPERGFKFSTMATRWVIKRIYELLDETYDPHKPKNKISSFRKIVRARSTLENRLHREPTVDELSRETGIPTVKIEDTTTIFQSTLSLNAPADRNNPERGEFVDTLHDPASDGRNLENVEDQIQVGALLQHLTPRERLVVSERIGLSDGDPKTLEEIGRCAGVTRETVRKDFTKALDKLAQVIG